MWEESAERFHIAQQMSTTNAQTSQRRDNVYHLDDLLCRVTVLKSNETLENFHFKM